MAFDPKTFLDTTYHDKVSTSVKPLDEDDYKAIIDNLEMRIVTTDEGKRHILRVKWKIVDEARLAAQGRDGGTVNQDLWLDLDDKKKDLDFSDGKNVGLGRLLEVVGLSPAGWKPGQLIGQGPFICRITQGKPTKSGDIYNDVSRVTRIS